MRVENVSRSSEFVALVASTRPVQLRGADHNVVFTRSALEDSLEQIRARFVPMTVEHLSHTPPIGRWYDGELVRAADGADELLLKGRVLRHFVPSKDPDVWGPLLTLVEGGSAAMPASVAIAEVCLEPRNFDDGVYELALKRCPYPVQPEERWSELPPLEWVLVIPVIWGLTRFVGSFLDALGRESGEALARWIHDLAAQSKDPHRDKLVTLRLKLPDGGVIYGHIPLRSDSDIRLEVEAAIDAAGRVAEIAGAQAARNVLGDIHQAAFLWADGEWHISWLVGTDDIVRVTNWYRTHEPDSTRLLGRLPPTPPRE